jgi:hypothetical protein
MVFMSLTNLRPYVIQPVDRRWLPSARTGPATRPSDRYGWT